MLRFTLQSWKTSGCVSVPFFLKAATKKPSSQHKLWKLILAITWHQKKASWKPHKNIVAARKLSLNLRWNDIKCVPAIYMKETSEHDRGRRMPSGSYRIPLMGPHSKHAATKSFTLQNFSVFKRLRFVSWTWHGVFQTFVEPTCCGWTINPAYPFGWLKLMHSL